VLSKGSRDPKLLNRDIDDWTITFADTGLNSNIGQRLTSIKKFLEGEDVFLANYADGFTDLHLPDMIDHFTARNKTASFVAVKPRHSFHVVSVKNEDEVDKIQHLTQSGIWINGGYFVFKKEIFNYIKNGEELVSEPFQRLIEKDELIKFQPLAVFLPKSKSKAGILEGYMHETPWFMVRAAGIDIRKIFNPKSLPLVGKVLGILDMDTVNPILVLKDVVVDEKSDKTVAISPKTYARTVSIMDKSFYPDGRNSDNIVLLDKFNKSGKDFTVGTAIESNTIIKNINGPGGRLISLEEYNKLTEHGCGFCSGDLPVAMANRVMWIQDAPVCITCGTETSGNRLN
jgi:glucose-1-phosphate cytidylyltransferase